MISASGSAGGRWLMGLLSVVLIALLLYTVVSLVPDLRASAREAEAKQNLHTIQLALERYSVDTIDWTYPLWLSGGEIDTTLEHARTARLKLDPLLDEGYLPAYPANPFARQDRQQRILISVAQSHTEDPLLLFCKTSDPAPVMRFGKDFTLMGNVLANARMAQQYCGLDQYSKPLMRPTGADTFFFCVDQPQGSPNRLMLQGQFGYVPTSYSDQLEFSVARYDGKSVPTGYQLLGWGAANQKGKNVLSTASLKRQRDANGSEMLGWEPTSINSHFLEESDIYGAVASNRELTEMLFIPTTAMPGELEDGVCIMLSSGIGCRKGWVEPVPEVTASDASAPDATEDSNGS
ncbi:MAG: hypothetical protein R3F46_14950 [bacterium]